MTVRKFDSREGMGQAAAEAIAAAVGAVLRGKEVVRIVFAAAPSQKEVLRALAESEMAWGRVIAFHMDEYLGLEPGAPQGFGNFLRDRLFSKVPLKQVHYLNGQAADPLEECRRYARLLEQHPPDIVVLGIGENSHLAFNDPHAALFDDPLTVKVVELDANCRRQQVNDGCFATIEEVPTHALTLTIPALMQAGSVFGIVPGKRKAAAVWHTLHSEICERYPSTILRRHPNVALYLDEDSGGHG
ncbi:MAG TPA: glucosamine-6-phosphate deaminase [Puia sp.]|nr:glucosamine-6-phosphate deaminase [Puia sp.]